MTQTKCQCLKCGRFMRVERTDDVVTYVCYHCGIVETFERGDQ